MAATKSPLQKKRYPKKSAAAKKAARKRTPAQIEALRKHAFKKGDDPRRNTEGINGWTEARKRVQEALTENHEVLVQRLFEFIDNGDVTALKMALGPMLPQLVQEAVHKHEHEGTVTFRWEGEES